MLIGIGLNFTPDQSDLGALLSAVINAVSPIMVLLMLMADAAASWVNSPSAGRFGFSVDRDLGAMLVCVVGMVATWLI